MTSKELLRVILASSSRTRQTMIQNAGLDFDVVPPGVDEAAIKQSMLHDGADGRAIADALAELKAIRVSRRHPGRFVIGADQVLVCDGVLFDKPADIDGARQTLQRLRGKTHDLITAAVVSRDGAPIWRQVDTAHLAMRPFSDGFIERYLDDVGEAVTWSVGAYQLEGRGIQLFSRITGDYFTILGLPLLPLLDFLRGHNVVAE